MTRSKAYPRSQAGDKGTRLLMPAQADAGVVRVFTVRAPDGRGYEAGEYRLPGGGTRCVLRGRQLELYRDGPRRYRLQDGTLMVEGPAEAGAPHDVPP